jgi:tetratricopeptide (TPR) repeat protein
MCDDGEFEQAEDLLRRIPASVLLAEKRDALLVFRVLTDFHARHVRWKEALTYANKAVECEPGDVTPYFSQLALLAITEDVENYRLRSRDLINRYRAPSYLPDGEGVTKLCMLLPPSDVDLALVEHLADLGLKGRKGDQFLPYSQFAKGLIEFRVGNFTDARDWLQKSIDNDFIGDGHSRYVQSYMVLAMALHRLNEPEKARAAFAQGDAIRQAKLPAIDSGDLGSGWYWRDWVIAHVLMKEAKALLEGGPAAPVDPDPH